MADYKPIRNESKRIEKEIENEIIFIQINNNNQMANVKTGFSYYNTDTDRYQDIKIKRLKRTFGCNGVSVYDYILCEIFRVKGCFLEWDESTAFDVSEYFGLKESVVNEIVNYCCYVGLFDKELHASGRVLTSASIQRRYREMCVRAKRKEIVIPDGINLIPEQLPIIPEQSPIIPSICDRVNKSKEEYRKEDVTAIYEMGENFEKAKAAATAIFFTWNKTKNLVHTKGLSERETSLIEAACEQYGSETVEKAIAFADRTKGLNGSGKNAFRAMISWFFKPENLKTVIDQMSIPVPITTEERQIQAEKCRKEAEIAEKVELAKISAIKERLYNEMKAEHGEEFSIPEWEKQCKIEISKLNNKQQ